jgi:hypothetical protein
MAFTQVAAPNFNALVSGNANLFLLQALGFSSDSRVMLVHASFADSAVQPTVTQQSIWLYDIESRSYISNLNNLLTQDPVTFRELDLRNAAMAGPSNQNTLILEYQLRGSTEPPKLALVKDGVLIQRDLLDSLLGSGAQVRVERFELSADERYLAIQTSSAALAKEQEPDSNEVSDIYLIDLNNLETQPIQRISSLGAFEANLPSLLGGVYADAQGVSVLFATEDNFSKQDQNGESTEVLGRSDAYLWRNGHNATGLQGQSIISLASAPGVAALAAGGVETEALWLTKAGAMFNSSATNLIANDTNQAVDAFLRTPDGGVSRVDLDGLVELAQGAQVLSSSTEGSLLVLLTTLPEDTSMSAQKLVLSDTRTNEWTVVSENDRPADDSAFAARLSPNGSVLAFNSNATNLVSGQDNSAIGGQLFLTETGLKDSSISKTIGGEVRHWKTQKPLQEVNLQGQETQVKSNNQGLFELTVVPTELSLPLSITAQKTPTGSTAATTGITLTDVLGALKVYLGKPLPDAYNSDLKFVAADFDGNGNVNLSDVLGLLKFYLNKPVSVAPAWVFLDNAQTTPVNGQLLHLSNKNGQTLSSSSSIPAPILVDLNSDEPIQLVGVLRGDVDGSFGV